MPVKKTTKKSLGSTGKEKDDVDVVVDLIEGGRSVEVSNQTKKDDNESAGKNKS